MAPAHKVWKTIAVSVDGPVATVRLDRPDRRNAVSSEMVAEIYAALSELAESSASVVLLTGTGDTFCPGADLTATAGEEVPALPEPEAYQAARLLHEMPQVTIAAVNGGCAGAGLAYAAACDLRVATARARFATAFLEVGLAGELGLARLLRHHLGGAWARDISFLPRKLSAQDALRMGLVTKVFSDDTFVSEVDALVVELAGRSPAALRTMKANFLDSERLSLADYIDVETARHHAPFTGVDAVETQQRLRRQAMRISGA